MTTYNPGVPTGTIPLNEDYINLQNNFSALDYYFGIDHIPFSNGTSVSGFHVDIHLNPISTTATNAPNNVPPVVPANVAGFGQFFSCQLNDGYRADNSLFFLSGTGRLSQLTANFQPSIASNFGRTYLPGPGASSGTSGTVTMQWGIVTGSDFTAGAGTVMYSPQFPKSTISIWTQLLYSGTTLPNHDNTLAVSDNYDNTGFDWSLTSSSSKYVSFFWVAIGT